MFNINQLKVGYPDSLRRTFGQAFGDFKSKHVFEISAPNVIGSLKVVFSALRDKERKKFEIQQEFADNELHIRFYNPSEGGWSGAIGRMGTIRIGTTQLLFSFQMSVLPGGENYLVFYQFDEVEGTPEAKPSEAEGATK